MVDCIESCIEKLLAGIRKMSNIYTMTTNNRNTHSSTQFRKDKTQEENQRSTFLSKAGKKYLHTNSMVYGVYW